ncbi:thioredoxin family protein [bacterium]|nr:thioredoxin family protein [bacterium]
MKIIKLFILSIFILISCIEVVNKVIVDDKTGRPMLSGVTERSAFELPEFAEWYNNEYTGYEPDEFILKQIKALSDSIAVQIFMGTWCSDSRREVPRFLKVLDGLSFNEKKVQIVNVNRKKKSPTHEEKNKNIEFVPTFIINKNGIEIGRIMEFPIITLEGDLLSILLRIYQ